MSVGQAGREATPGDRVPRDGLFWQDELLQALYWLTGEGLGPNVRWEDLAVLMGGPDEVLAAAAQSLAERGLADIAKRDGLRTVCLTPAGLEEGRRRFVDQFSELLGQAHGECGPDCECHRGNPGERCWQHGTAAGA